MILSIKKMGPVLQCFLLSVLFLGFTNIFSTVAGSSQGLYSGKQVVVEGDAFNITCQTDVFAFIKWQKDSRPIVGSLLQQYNVTEHREDNSITSSISNSHAQTSHSGSYRCGTFVENTYNLYVLSANSISVNYDAGSTIYKSIDFKLPLEIQCNTTEIGIRMEWEKDGENITEPKNPRIKITKDNKLVIDEPKPEDAGNYSCRIFKQDAKIGEKNIIVIAKPHVGMQKDVTVVEGEKLTLECIVRGTPPLNISWTVGNETYYSNQGRVTLKPHLDVPNALFVIDVATMDDRGSYSCIATNANNFTDSTTTYVRVKDKLAALWPFLGICAEVFVLCAIILIYEKKRNKTELEESDTDNSPETKNTPDHGKDSVRQRK